MSHTSELHVPLDIADAIRALRPELRAKLSLRDVDDITRPFRKHIRELEAQAEQDVAVNAIHHARIRELEEAIRNAPCDSRPDSRCVSFYPECAGDCNCWKSETLENTHPAPPPAP